MSVEITNEEVHEVDKGGEVRGYLVKSTICNTGAEDKDVVIRQWPYDADGKKLEKKEMNKTIPAGECITVAFEYPADRKPAKTYTDVWARSPDGTKGDLLDGEKNKLVAMNVAPGEWGSTKSYAQVQLAYPGRIFEAFGAGFLGMFSIDPVEGVPPGWSGEMIDPIEGSPYFVAAHDRVNPGVLRIVAPPDPVEGTVAELTITQRVVGAPDEPLYVLPEHIRVVVDTTPPQVVLAEVVPDQLTRTILVRAQGSDPVSGVDYMRVYFDVDASDNWAEAALFPQEDWAPGDDLTFEGTLGPFCAGQTVRTMIEMWDTVGNSVRLPPEVTQF